MSGTSSEIGSLPEMVEASGCESLSEFDDSDVKHLEDKGRLPQAAAWDAFSDLGMSMSKEKAEWKVAEANRALGYNGCCVTSRKAGAGTIGNL